MAPFGQPADQQAHLDSILADLDGTPQFTRLGGNALIATSLAAAHAAAAGRNMPLWQSLGGTTEPLIPVPEIQIFGGGAHAAGAMDLPQLCAEQWIEPNRRLEEAERTAPPNEHWTSYRFEEFIRSPQERAQLLLRASTSLGLESSPALEAAARTPPKVNVTAPSAAARWRKREAQLLPLLDRSALSGLAARLGYDREKLDEWI